MNNRKRMRDSNLLVRKWLLENGYDDIWFKPHGKRNDWVFTQKGNYMAQDLWNLFDGICFNRYGKIRLLQMKTNNWAKQDPLVNFSKKHDVSILSFNVSNKIKSSGGKYKVFVRVIN